MRGYDEKSYGDAFADVYDDWYTGISDTAGTVGRLCELIGAGPALELGVGTGRIAIPLAIASGVEIVGVDASSRMLDRLSAKPDGDRVTTVLGDMSGPGIPHGSFSLVYVTYNTFFNLTSDALQRLCFVAVASRLGTGGRCVIEAFVPRDPPREGPAVELRSMAVDRVVLSASIHDPVAQRAEGHLIELTEDAGVRLHPWSIRYSTPDELDAMAADAGLTLEERSAGWHGEPFDESSAHHVSIYRHAV